MMYLLPPPSELKVLRRALHLADSCIPVEGSYESRTTGDNRLLSAKSGL